MSMVRGSMWCDHKIWQAYTPFSKIAAHSKIKSRPNRPGWHQKLYRGDILERETVSSRCSSRALQSNLRLCGVATNPSAEFGLIAAETPIPDYDRRMTRPRALALRTQVRDGLAATLAAGDYAATCINLGADYMPALPLDHESIPRLGVVTAAQGGIGSRMGQMKRWLLATKAAAR